MKVPHGTVCHRFGENEGGLNTETLKSYKELFKSTKDVILAG